MTFALLVINNSGQPSKADVLFSSGSTLEGCYLNRSGTCSASDPGLSSLLQPSHLILGSILANYHSQGTSHCPSPREDGEEEEDQSLSFCLATPPLEPQLLPRNLHQGPSSPVASGTATVLPGPVAWNDTSFLSCESQAAVPVCPHHFPHLHDYSPSPEVSDGLCFLHGFLRALNQHDMLNPSPETVNMMGGRSRSGLTKKTNAGPGQGMGEKAGSL